MIIMPLLSNVVFTFFLQIWFQEAYDRVDRKVLFRKLKQLNFPDRLLPI